MWHHKRDPNAVLGEVIVAEVCADAFQTFQVVNLVIILSPVQLLMKRGQVQEAVNAVEML
jgi:hypothetical protein